MRKTPPDRPISIRFEPDVRAALERLAKADNRKLSAYVKMVMRKHVADAGEKKGGRS